MSARCIICDYELHGLDPARNCPECGTPIERSLKGDLLRFADQRWLRSVHRGLRWITWSAITLLGACIAMPVVLILRMGSLNVKAELVLAWIFAPITMLTPLGIVVGSWLATMPEPRELQRSSVRPIVLRAVAIAVVPMIGMVLLTTSNANPMPVWLQWVLLIGAFLTILTHMTMFNELLQALERRCEIVDEKRRKLLQAYRRDGVGCGAGLAGIGLLVVATGAIPGIPRPGLGLGILIMLWFITLGFAQGTAKRIAVERAATERAIERPAAPASA